MASQHKRKRQIGTSSSHPASFTGAQLDTTKPTATYRPIKGRSYTVSLALPGSIIANAQSHDAKTAVASTVARALAVFSVDEVVVFNDGQSIGQKVQNSEHAAADAASGYSAFSDPDHFLIHILSYLETPPHLRKALFGFHPDLRTAGACPSLDMPHHLRTEEWCRWREGVTIAEASDHGSSHGKRRKSQVGNANGHEQTLVNCGLSNYVSVPVSIPMNTRVTLDFGASEAPDSYNEAMSAMPTDPAAPREEAGYFWGYSGGYDLCIGTSERGQPVRDFTSAGRDQSVPQWQHLLIVLGGVAGLEAAVGKDEQLKDRGVTEPKELFDAWLNLVPKQGSRTIRTEEAVWLALMGLAGFVEDRDQSHR